MRLRDIFTLLDSNIDKVVINLQGLGNNQVNFANRATARKALVALQEIPSLSDDVKAVLKHSIFTDDSTVSAGTDGQLHAKVQKIQTDGKALLEFLRELLPDEPDGYFTVRFPESNEVPSAIMKRFDGLQLAFEQPAYRVFGIPLKVTLVEPGSVLAELGFYLPAASTVAAGAVTANQVLKFLGKLLDLGIQKAKLQQEAAIAKQKHAEAEQAEAIAKQEVAKIRQEVAKADQESSKAQQAALAVRFAEKAMRAAELKLEGHDLQIDSAVHLLSAQSQDPNDAFPIVRNSIDQIAAMYSSNTTFELQLGAAADVSSEFPAETQPSKIGITSLTNARTKALLSS